jgi:hypothetical protein
MTARAQSSSRGVVVDLDNASDEALLGTRLCDLPVRLHGASPVCIASLRPAI